MYKNINKSKMKEQGCQPLFFKDTKLTIYGPKRFHENSRNHLRNCSTPGKHKAKNNCAETGEKSYFILTTLPLPQDSIAQIVCGFSLGVAGEEGAGRIVERVSNIQAFQRAAQRTLLPDLES